MLPFGIPVFIIRNGSMLRPQPDPLRYYGPAEPGCVTSRDMPW